jgi:hypothetical protein
VYSVGPQVPRRHGSPDSEDSKGAAWHGFPALAPYCGMLMTVLQKLSPSCDYALHLLDAILLPREPWS